MGSKFNDDDFVAPEAEGGHKFLKAAVCNIKNRDSIAHIACN